MSLRIALGIAVVAAMGLGCNQILDNQLIGLAADGGESSTRGDATTTDAHAQGDAAADAADSGPADATLDQAAKDAAGDAPDALSRDDAGDGGCGPLTDIHSCGSCANDCSQLLNVSATGLGCSAGRCTYECAPNYADCADAGIGCGTALSAAANCGACGASCPASAPLCSPTDAGAYACATECSAGQTLCSGACVNLQSDVANCGACGASCAQLPHVLTTGLTCTAGTCAYQCATGFSDCGNTGMGCTTSLSTTANCGACTNACTGMTPVCQAVTTSTFGCTSGCQTSETNCSGSCTTLASDSSNCGKCGMACPPAETCQAGTCQCPTAAKPTLCNGTCTNTLTDGSNCGQCGMTCSSMVTGATSSCDGTGHCTAPACTTAGDVVCGSACVNESGDPANCGRCGHSCQGGTCSGGVCQPVTIAPVGSVDFVDDIAIDANFVYWVEQQDRSDNTSMGSVRKAPIAGGGTFTTLAGDQPSPMNIAVNSTGLFWINFGADSPGGLMFLPAGGVNATAVATAFNSPSAMTLSATNVYWFDDTAGAPSAETLLSLPMNSLTPTAAPTSIANAAKCALAMVANGAHLFWLQSGCFAGSGGVGSAAIPPTAASITSLLPSGTLLNGPYANSPFSVSEANLGINSKAIYFSSTGSLAEMLEFIPLGGGPATTLSSVASPSGVTADETNVYWTDVSTVETMPIGGGTITTLATGQAGAYAIAVDANSVYWSINASPGAVMKVAKP